MLERSIPWSLNLNLQRLNNYAGPLVTFFFYTSKIRISMYDNQDKHIHKCLQDLGLPGMIYTEETKYILSPNRSVKRRMIAGVPTINSLSFFIVCKENNAKHEITENILAPLELVLKFLICCGRKFFSRPHLGQHSSWYFSPSAGQSAISANSWHLYST